METISTALSFLDQQESLAIWYAQYDGNDEYIRYANETFANVFGLSVEDILEKKRYRLVNPPDISDEVIEQYKEEDRVAMERGSFLSVSPMEEGQEIVVVKLRFDQGILGLFQIVEQGVGTRIRNLTDLEEDFRSAVSRIRPDLFSQ